jgi:Peptidase C39 family
MALLATLLLIVLAVADFGLARRLAARPRRAFFLALAALVFLLTYLYLTLWSHLLANVPWDDFIYFERLPAHAAILFIIALCWYLPGRLSRGTILFLLILGGGYGLLEVGGPAFLPVYAGSLSDQVQRLPDGQIEVIQSTGWSCGPAALAWALEEQGLSVTERQLAALAASTPFHGTGDSGMLRACHKLGVPAHLRRELSFDELRALPKPCLVSWHLSGLVMHWIVVLGAGPNKVQVGDPMMGAVDYTRAEFERKWMRDALVLQ